MGIFFHLVTKVTKYSAGETSICAIFEFPLKNGQNYQ